MCATLLAGWALWAVGVYLFGTRSPELYAAACLLLTAAWYLSTGRPGLLTLLVSTDPSGKHDWGVGQGCWPITLVLDVVSSPFQLPALVPLAKGAFVRARDDRWIRSAVHSPETLKQIIGRVRTGPLGDREREALKDACRIEHSIEPEDVATLIELFGGTLGSWDSDQALAWLIQHQSLSRDDLRRVFEIEKNRGHYERSVLVARHSRALYQLARHPDTPLDVLEGIVEVDPIGQARRAAEERSRGQ